MQGKKRFSAGGLSVLFAGHAFLNSSFAGVLFFCYFS